MMDTQPDSKDIHQLQLHNESEKLQPRGMHAMQGQELLEDNQPPSPADETSSAELKVDPQSQEMVEEWNRTHDPANWEYKIGSPHADYQAAKDVQAAQQQHELGQGAMTADSLGDAIDTTLQARREAKPEEETPGDQYFREKYGTQPYTTDA
jgi:hypothetical protein